jgi:hypothetical protein
MAPSPVSTPCPTTLVKQWGQTGAMAWIAHSKLSKRLASDPSSYTVMVR